MAFRNTDSGEPRQAARTPDLPESTEVNRPDLFIWGIYGVLVVLSIIELYSASSFEISKKGLYSPLLRHVGMLFAGFLIILGLQRVHYSRFVLPGIGLALLSAVAMGYVMLFGEVVNGAKRAISTPIMSIQPAEFIKISAVLVLSYILGTTQLKKDETKRNRGLVWAVGVVLFFSLLLFTQGLTNTLILMTLCISMLCIGALEGRKLLIIFAVFAACGALGIGVKMLMSESEPQEKEIPLLVDQRGQTFHIPEAAGSTDLSATSRLEDKTWSNRIKNFFDPTPHYERPLTSKNIQEMRSYMAQAHGGVTGVMPGNSRETSRLPLAFSDFIFAIIVEDLGFVGGLFIMILFLSLLARAYFIAYKCHQMYPAFLVTGCALLITLQALCHMAIVTGAGPVSGQPLPLFSKGGTSILVTSIAFGIMLSVSKYAARGKLTAAARETDKQALPEDLQAVNPTQA